MAVFNPGIIPYSYADDDPVRYVDYFGLGIFDWVKGIFKKNSCKLGKYRQKASPRVRRKKEKNSPNDHHDSGKERWPKYNFQKISSIGFSGFDRDVPNPSLPDIPNRVPKYKGRDIPENSSISFTEDIKFNGNKNTFYDLPASEKT